jgi:hypothetical protein
MCLTVNPSQRPGVETLLNHSFLSNSLPFYYSEDEYCEAEYYDALNETKRVFDNESNSSYYKDTSTRFETKTLREHSNKDSAYLMESSESVFRSFPSSGCGCYRCDPPRIAKLDIKMFRSIAEEDIDSIVDKLIERYGHACFQELRFYSYFIS